MWSSEEEVLRVCEACVCESDCVKEYGTEAVTSSSVRDRAGGLVGCLRSEAALWLCRCICLETPGYQRRPSLFCALWKAYEAKLEQLATGWDSMQYS